ncbi:type III-B CRISPR-associated protein Cas10/Cmr2 [Bacteroidia bacterium]|nr:type III-B CRISPR-associated protein Cas10/Cmr2 [Bacteroidia bacterium]
MKLILREIANNKYGTILAQDISTLFEDEKLHGAGVYSDRCYIRLNKDFGQDDYKSLINSIIEQLEAKDKKALREYLQIYCTVQNISDRDNYMQILNDQLDVMELQAKYYHRNIYALASGYDNLKKLKRDTEKIILPTNVDDELINKWYKLGFDKKDRDDLIFYKNIKNGVYSFPSLLEITTKGLERFKPNIYRDKIHPLFEKSLGEEIDGKKDKTAEDNEILKEIKKSFPDNFQTAHKYAVIVTADGDNVGKLISHVSEKNDDDLLQSLATNIADFAKEASKLIYIYGGKPVYIGGDDLVFFAPVVSHSGEHKESWFQGDGHIFQLISVLDKTFNDIWKQWLTDNKITDIHPSLSYGMSITYYKFPLNEAMKLSGDLLFEVAKKYPTEANPSKNCIAVQLMTHSGSYDKVVFEKQDPTDSTFYHLQNLLENFGDKESTISSVLQRLRGDTELILSIANDGDTFDAYFTNEYNLHDIKDRKKEAFIRHSISLFNKIFAQQKDKPKEALNQLCSMYRLLNFLIHKETGNGSEI